MIQVKSDNGKGVYFLLDGRNRFINQSNGGSAKMSDITKVPAEKAESKRDFKKRTLQHEY